MVWVDHRHLGDEGEERREPPTLGLSRVDPEREDVTCRGAKRVVRGRGWKVLHEMSEVS